MKNLELFYPLKSFTVAQPFGGNANSAYHEQKLVGHTGIDLVSFWDDSIMAAQNGWIYKAIHADSPDLQLYRAVYQIVETDTGTYELCYGHCNQVLEGVGNVTTGTVVATEGNSGLVYYGNVLVSESEKKAGSHKGTHLHFQVRVVSKTRVLSQLELADGYFLITKDFTPLVSPDGYYYRIVNFKNGYNGCVDPSKFWNGFYADKSTEVVQNLTQQLTLAKKVVELIKKLFNL